MEKTHQCGVGVVELAVRVLVASPRELLGIQLALPGIYVPSITHIDMHADRRATFDIHALYTHATLDLLVIGVAGVGTLVVVGVRWQPRNLSVSLNYYSLGNKSTTSEFRAPGMALRKAYWAMCLCMKGCRRM